MIREIANFEKFHVQSAVRAFQSGPAAHAHVVSGTGASFAHMKRKFFQTNISFYFRIGRRVKKTIGEVHNLEQCLCRHSLLA